MVDVAERMVDLAEKRITKMQRVDEDEKTMANVAEKGVTRKSRRSKNDEGNKKSWPDLPEEILELIVGRLSYIDRVNIRAVCKSWHSAREFKLPTSHKKQMPWLLTFDLDGSWRSSKITDPTYKKTYTIDMSPLSRMIKFRRYLQVRESKSGWMLLTAIIRPMKSEDLQIYRNYRLVMYSPFLTLDNLLELPLLNTKSIILASFSFSDKSSRRDGCSFVVLGHITSTILEIHTCKWGDDRWISCTHSNFQVFDVMNWTYSEGLLYYINIFGDVGTLSVDGQECSSRQSAYMHQMMFYHHAVRMTKSDEGELYLFLISKEVLWNRCSPMTLDAYRLDLSKSQTTATWEHIKSLGQNRALFLDNEYKSFVKVSNVPEEMADRIYNCSRSEFRDCGFPQGTLSDSCIKYFGSIAKQPYHEKLWIEPPDSHC